MHTVQRIVRAAGFGLTVDLVPIVDNPAHDRGNELVSYLYRPLHPAILRMVR